MKIFKTIAVIIASLLIILLIYRHSIKLDGMISFNINGMATVYNLKTGEVSEQPTQEYCKRYNKTVVWRKIGKNDKLNSYYAEGSIVYISTPDTEKVLFDMKLLFNDTMTISANSIKLTDDGRIFLLAERENDHESGGLYEFIDGKAIKVLDNNFTSIDYSKNYLLFHDWVDIDKIFLYDYKEGIMRYIDDGHSPFFYNDDTIGYMKGDNHDIHLFNILTEEKTIIPMKQNEFIDFNYASVNYDDRSGVAYISYTNDKGLSPFPDRGFLNLSTGKLISLSSYMRLINHRYIFIDIYDMFYGEMDWV